MFDLPEKTHCCSIEDVEKYVYECLSATRLKGWIFAFMDSCRRLGSCDVDSQQIMLSRSFTEAYLHRDQALIRRVIMHELAHALAWDRLHYWGHGTPWKVYCAALGIPREKATTNVHPWSAKQKKYAICHKETGEIFVYYERYPTQKAKELNDLYIKNRKEETLGKLIIKKLG